MRLLSLAAVCSALACTSSDVARMRESGTPPPTDSVEPDTNTGDSTGGTDSGPTDSDSGSAPSTPAACARTIHAARANPSSAEPALADADADADAYGADPTPRQVHLQWTGDPSTEATVLWRTEANTLSSRVEIGTSEAYGAFVSGASFLVEGAESLQRVHEVRICGLSPGTSYAYRVGGETGISAGYTFTTAPAPGDAGVLLFGVAGDSRGAATTWGQVLAGMANNGVEFVLFSGDAVNRGSEVSEWDAWFEAGAGFIESRAVVPAHGNHEYYAQAYFALNATPNNERWYSFDYGNVHVAVVDDEISSDEEWQEQATWLAADLAASTQTWKFLLHHEPAYSSSLVHATNSDVREWVVPVAEAGGVDFDFAGHNHHYERTVPIRADAQDDATGITYVITGGAGAPLYDNDEAQWYTRVAVVSHHYTIVRIEGDVLTLLVYDLAGNLLDTHVRQKG